MVRVSKVENVRARMILESHHFFTPTFNNRAASFLGLAENEAGNEGKKNWGVGPFIALQPGSDEVIDAIGAGLMVGFRRPNAETQSFNIGVGVLYDINSQVLGDGIEENKPLPGIETEVRYKERSQDGLLIMSSFSFYFFEDALFNIILLPYLRIFILRKTYTFLMWRYYFTTIASRSQIASAPATSSRCVEHMNFVMPGLDGKHISA